jgi:hypothetical protein
MVLPARPALVVLALLLGSCGHKANPLPPLRRTPPAPADFRLAQRGDALELSATAPATSVDGRVYDRLSLEFLHATGEVDIDKRGQKRVATALPGERVTALLPLPAPGTLVRAAARGLASGQRGARTLTKALLTVPPLDPPRELLAVAGEEGVRLSWQGILPAPAPPPPVGPRPPLAGPPPTPASSPTVPAVPPAVSAPPAAPAPSPAGTAVTPPSAGASAGSAPDAGPRRNGFFVYRRPASVPAYGAPLGGEPLDRSSAVDAEVPLGTSFCYVVRAVASTDPLLESDPSNEACVTRQDTTAPPAPAGLALLPREGGLELLWSPSAETDLAGYQVYRAAAAEVPVRLARVGPEKAAFLDETAERGVTYRYTLTALDAAGTESEPSESVEGSLP